MRNRVLIPMMIYEIYNDFIKVRRKEPMNSLIKAIDKEASALPLEFQREVLDFIGYLHTKRERQSDPAWLERAWGAAPDFPDRLPQLPISDVKRF